MPEYLLELIILVLMDPQRISTRGPSRRWPGIGIFARANILSNRTKSDQTNKRLLLMSRRIQNGTIFLFIMPM